uniref:Uncharacterized protein n=1 Tax=Phytophthora ramorum TaxID=164328 RepID=H3GR35_PHYRM
MTIFLEDEPTRMLASGVTYGVMAATLIAVAAYAIIVSRRSEINSVTSFVSAKNSTTTLRLAWCFFSAGIGAGTLFSYPQIGVDAGSWGVIGYALSGVTGMVVLALVGPYTRSALGENVTMTDVRATRTGALAGSAAGLLTIFICGVIAQGKFVGGFNWFILPEGLYSQNSMITFIVTLIVPPVVTVGVSLMTAPKAGEGAKDDSYLLEHSPVQEISKA